MKVALKDEKNNRIIGVMETREPPISYKDKILCINCYGGEIPDLIINDDGTDRCDGCKQLLKDI